MGGTLTVGAEGEEKVQTTNWLIVSQAAKVEVGCITQRSRVQIPPPQPAS